MTPKETLDIIIRVAVIIILIEVIIMLIFVSILHRQPIVIEEEEIIWMSPCAQNHKSNSSRYFSDLRMSGTEHSNCSVDCFGSNSSEPIKQSSMEVIVGMRASETRRCQEAKRHLCVLRGGDQGHEKNKLIRFPDQKGKQTTAIDDDDMTREFCKRVCFSGI